MCSLLEIVVRTVDGSYFLLVLVSGAACLIYLVSIRQTINLFALDKWQPVIPTWTHKIRL